MTSNVALNEMIQSVGNRLTRHEDYCIEERDKAAKARHDFRAEVALTLGSLRSEMSAGFEKLHERISKTNDKHYAILLILLGLLISACAFLFTKLMGWV